MTASLQGLQHSLQACHASNVRYACIALIFGYNLARLLILNLKHNPELEQLNGTQAIHRLIQLQFKVQTIHISYLGPAHHASQPVT